MPSVHPLPPDPSSVPDPRIASIRDGNPVPPSSPSGLDSLSPEAAPTQDQPSADSRHQFCPICGDPAPPVGFFCGNCGGDLRSSQTPSSPAAASIPAAAMPPPPGSPPPRAASSPISPPTPRVAQPNPGPTAPAYGTYPPSGTTSAGNGFSAAGIILGAIAFLFFPIILGPAGLIMGAVAKSRGEKNAVIAIVVSACGLIIGMLLGIIFFGSLA